MFLETILILLLTFFAAVGLMDISDRILRRSFRKNRDHRLFAVSDISGVPEDELEDHIRFMTFDSEGMERTVILDLRDVEGEKLRLALALSARFGCFCFKTEEEAKELFAYCLQSPKKKV